MKRAEIFINQHYQIATVDRRIFGSFIEHLGRAVYGGIYQKGNPNSDEHGFRKDTLNLVRELRVPIVRYPGGNFVSGFSWEDSVGPKDRRPAKIDLAWQAIETNQFGLNEFTEWSDKAGCDIMMAVNLGTKGPQDAKNLLEYCNFVGGTDYSDLRRAHGYAKPHDIKLWCLGNEMDGSWQIGHKTAREYGRLASNTAQIMKSLDQTIETVVCGSSGLTMPTFGEWEYQVLDECYDEVDYISLHLYLANRNNDTTDFLAGSQCMDDYISGVASICDAVKAKKHRKKEIELSFDEWNVWYHSEEQDEQIRPWSEAPHQLEDVYNFEDALLVGSMLITLLRHADRVKIACLAQLVNAIAPIMTSDTRAWRQTIFYPYLHASTYGRGTVLLTQTNAPRYESRTYGTVSVLDSVCIWDQAAQSLTIFAVNKDLNDDVEITCDLRQFCGYRVKEHLVLACNDMKAINTETAPNTVRPIRSHASRVEESVLRGILGKHSWNVIRLERYADKR
ncbi:Alpha-N-arabinofuranosidase [Coriobacterium glomerans PW2]|uniref:non-reducing end alpha-L-arabinofuranosidase n=1 Tax=Coriobacterium glomerans (strain ATCC 49209 / DSM 20642 / JCM 10262 / PW2) TaxID=700015 RepID=F2NAY7_CORGP|nr:alpha-N-arabinofuranosidase [Coriobacterium glomerans]AEB07665.1 Alpha-N-arabinofuranosidase [Coriobacterium glomerans PW2]